jgi:hypothetical protein
MGNRGFADREQVMAGEGGIASSNGKGQIVIECSTLPIEVKAHGEAPLAAQGKQDEVHRQPSCHDPQSGGGRSHCFKSVVIVAVGSSYRPATFIGPRI